MCYDGFYYFGHTMLMKKINKMLATALQKQLSNQHPNLHRFWNQLGSILGGFWEPSWSQVGTKSLQKSIQKVIAKMITFWIALGAILIDFAPNLGVWGGSKAVTFRTSFWSLGASWVLFGAEMAQDGSQARPRPLQNASWH